MSENTTPQATSETTEAQLTEGELENVAGGGLWELAEAAAAAVIKAVTPTMPEV